MKTKRKNIFKSLLALTLALIMVLGVAPLSELAGVDWASLFAPKAEAAESKSFKDGYYTYTVENGEATITECDKSIAGAVTIPDKLGGYTVTKIKSYAFYSCWNIESITIPAGVKEIYDDSFKMCWQLSNIFVSPENKNFASMDGVLTDYKKNKIIRYPEGKKESKYEIPSNISEIGTYAFEGNGWLSEVSIPNTVKRIERAAFNGCCIKKLYIDCCLPEESGSWCKLGFLLKLEEVSIGPNAKNIGELFFGSIGQDIWPFYSSLLTINLDAKNRNYTVYDGVLYNNNKTKLILYPNADSRSSFIMPETVEEVQSGEVLRYAKNLRYLHLSKNFVKASYDEGDYNNIAEAAFNFSGNLWTGLLPLALRQIDVSDGHPFLKSVDGILYSKDMKVLCLYPSNRESSNYHIPDTVCAISYSAFIGCKNLNLYFPKDFGKHVLASEFASNFDTGSIEDIFNCSSFSGFYVPEGDELLSSENGVLYNKDKTELLKYPIDKDEELFEIPSSVKRVEYFALYSYEMSKTFHPDYYCLVAPKATIHVGEKLFESPDFSYKLELPNGIKFCTKRTDLSEKYKNELEKYIEEAKSEIKEAESYLKQFDDLRKNGVINDYIFELIDEEYKFVTTGVRFPQLTFCSHDSPPFNQPTYIADIWSGNRKEKTPEHEQLSWYYNGYKPITRTIVEEMGDTAFKVWDGVKCISNPANGAKIALDKEKQRELIIFDAIRDVLGSPEFSDIISTSAARDLVGWTKSLNSAAKKIYGAEGIKTFEDFYKKYGKDTSNGKTKTKALVEAAYEDYQQDVGAVNCLSDLLTCVDSVLKIAKSSKEVINAFVNCMMVARMRESLKAVIDEMYAQSTDSDMRTALGNVKNYCVSEMNALSGTMVRSVAGIGVTVLKEFVGDFWDDLADMVPIAGPIIKGVKIGAAVGEGICNMLFSTGNTRDNYYLAKSTVEFVDIARKASLSLQKKYSANKTTEAANAYIDSVRLYISVLNLDAENGRKFCETACNDGLINGVANWINGGNAKYDEIERCTNSIQKSNKEFIDLISISWIFADNYLKTDYPEMYDTLCQNILTSPKYASTITQVKIDLSGKATVYFNVPSYAAGFKPVSGVQVQYKKNNGSYSMLANLANPYAKSASHSITLSNSDTYTYRVRTYAKLTTGKIEYSDWSEEYTTLANPAETPEIYCKVGAIGVDVRVKNNYFLSTGFNESQSGVVTTVEIYRRRQGESGKKLIGAISDVDRVNLFTDKNPGTTKCYYSARTVVRYNGKTYYSKYSQEVCTIMSGNIPKDPRLDINIRANSSSPKTRAVTYADAANGFSIELAWDKIDGISTYEVYRKLDEAKLYVYIGKTDSGNTSFVDNTVSEAGRYDYIIKFYQDIGGEKVLCGESQSASVLVERVAQQTETVEIKKGKTATISINSGNLSDGSTVSWSTSSDCITLTPSEDGTSCEVKANSKGSATVTVTITHADGSTVSDTFEIEAKSKGVFATIFDIILAPFRAIINLFKKLFGK